MWREIERERKRVRVKERLVFRQCRINTMLTLNCGFENFKMWIRI